MIRPDQKGFSWDDVKTLKWSRSCENGSKFSFTGLGQVINFFQLVDQFNRKQEMLEMLVDNRRWSTSFLVTTRTGTRLGPSP